MRIVLVNFVPHTNNCLHCNLTALVFNFQCPNLGWKGYRFYIIIFQADAGGCSPSTNISFPDRVEP